MCSDWIERERRKIYWEEWIGVLGKHKHAFKSSTIWPMTGHFVSLKNLQNYSCSVQASMDRVRFYREETWCTKSSRLHASLIFWELWSVLAIITRHSVAQAVLLKVHLRWCGRKRRNQLPNCLRQGILWRWSTESQQRRRVYCLSFGRSSYRLVRTRIQWSHKWVTRPRTIRHIRHLLPQMSQ